MSRKRPSIRPFSRGRKARGPLGRALCALRSGIASPDVCTHQGRPPFCLGCLSRMFVRL